MNCPRCHNSDIEVIDTRDCDSDCVRRRRECVKCHYRFTTYERIEPIKLSVQKRSGGVEPYNREKVIRGMKIATEKRDIDVAELEEIADRIEQKLIETGKPMVPSRKIGNLVIKELKELDEVSYLRFASVYKGFCSGKSFEKELEKLKQ